MADPISQEGLEALSNYKYRPGAYTPLDLLLNPYWEAVTARLPMWVAPNLLTLLGSLFIILPYSLTLAHDTSLSRPVPNYCFLLAAAGVWIYMTLDAVDGKQARRTKSSSPLGQLFDHGCDSFSIT